METTGAKGRSAAESGWESVRPSRTLATRAQLDIEGMVERVVALAARYGVEAPPSPARIGIRPPSLG